MAMSDRILLPMAAIASLVLLMVAVVSCEAPLQIPVKSIAGSGHGAVYLALESTADPVFGGIHYTKVRIGSNGQEINVLVDTGSDVPWVKCSSCSTCSPSLGAGIEFDPSSSLSARVLHCGDTLCDPLFGPVGCTSKTTDQCQFNLRYTDATTASGYILEDKITFDVVTGPYTSTNDSATLVFGCTDSLQGYLNNSNIAIHGIFGFGQGPLSIVSQFFAQRLAPNVFAHCIDGNLMGKGTLVLGEVPDPRIVYSPLTPSRIHYYLYMKSISVNGQLLPIDRRVFSHHGRATAIDSGTALAYIIEEAYGPLIQSISNAIPFESPIVSGEWMCYALSESAFQLLPAVSFNFEGGASFEVKPEKYMVNGTSTDGAPLRCIGFQKTLDRESILGVLALKDNIVVYDLDQRRIGWASYDCSKSLHVNLTWPDNVVKDGQAILDRCVLLKATLLTLFSLWVVL